MCVCSSRENEQKYKIDIFCVFILKCELKMLTADPFTGVELWSVLWNVWFVRMKSSQYSILEFWIL